MRIYTDFNNPLLKHAAVAYIDVLPTGELFLGNSYEEAIKNGNLVNFTLRDIKKSFEILCDSNIRKRNFNSLAEIIAFEKNSHILETVGIKAINDGISI